MKWSAESAAPRGGRQGFGFLSWFYAAWKAATALILVVGSNLPTAILGWDTMLFSGKLVAVVGLIVSGWKALDMSVRETVKRLMEGKSPVEIPTNGNSGNTQHIQRPAEPGK